MTSFATKSDSCQKKVWVMDGEGCTANKSKQDKQINEELFRIVVPGDAFECAYSDDGTALTKISAMKQKLREKKQK